MTEEKEVKEETDTEKTTDKKPNKTLAIILTVVVGVAVLYGVGSNTYRAFTQRATEQVVEETIEEATEKEAEVDISEGGEKITVETEEGSFTVGKQELPENFPTDMPIYPGSTILSTSSNADNTVVIFSTDDSVETVTDYYKKELASDDWEVETTASMANATLLGINKGELNGGIVINESDEETQIVIELEKTSGE